MLLNKAEGKTLLQNILTATSEVHLLEHLQQLKCSEMIMYVPSVL